jgi:hypothetical protein
MRQNNTQLVGVLVILLASHCSEEEDAQPGPESDTTATDLGGGTSALVLPDPPVLTPCPSGWREVPPEDGDSPATCDPYPETIHDHTRVHPRKVIGYPGTGLSGVGVQLEAPARRLAGNHPLS